jgi:hypothetical protein
MAAIKDKYNERGFFMMYSFFRKTGFSLLIFIALALSACSSNIVDAEITLNKNGSGSAKIVAEAEALLGMEELFWEELDEVERGLRKKNINANISRHTGQDKVSATIRIRSNDIVEDFNQLGDDDYDDFEILHFVDGKSHRVEITDKIGIQSIKLNMPGRVIESNGNHYDSTVRWENPPSLYIVKQNYWAVSESSGIGSFGSVGLIFVLAFIIFGIIFLVVKRKKPVVENLYDGTSHFENIPPSFSKRERFCSECGNPMDPSERFCSECGTKRE